MSVINQMLKDLEKRTRHSPESKVILTGLGHAQPDKSNFSLNWKMTVPILLLILLSLFIVLKKVIGLSPAPHQTLANHVTKAVSPVIQLKKNNERIMPAKELLTPINPTALTGIVLETHQNGADLRFMLSQTVLYRLDFDEKNKKIMIHLEHAYSVPGIPPIDRLNSLIKRMEMTNQSNGELEIAIVLQDGVEMKRVELNQQDHYPELELELFQQSGATGDSKLPMSQVRFGGNGERSVKQLVVDGAANEAYKKAMEALSAGEEEQAKLLLTDLVDTYPEYVAACETLIKLLLRHGDNKEAENVLLMGLKHQPHYLPFIELRARMLADANKNKEALVLLQSDSPKLNDHPDYYGLMAVLYQRVGEFMMSAKLYEQLLKMNGNKAVWWIGLGIALESLDRRNEALQAYTKAAESDGLTPELNAFVSGRIQTA